MTDLLSLGCHTPQVGPEGLMNVHREPRKLMIPQTKNVVKLIFDIHVLIA